MLKIEKHVTLSPEQWEMVIEGLRNPKNSWDRSDSYTTSIENPVTGLMMETEFFLGEKDLELMSNLNHGGPVHAKYRRMMPVWVTINAPLYWWKEFDTYKVGTVANSCSTMHKIHSRDFTQEDFSFDKIIEAYKDDPKDEVIKMAYGETKNQIMVQNRLREAYITTKDKKYWYAMIQLLGTSYNQKRTVMLGYEVLTNIYMWRANHKLDEWHTFCDWIEELPYAELIIDECKKAHEPKVAVKDVLDIFNELKSYVIQLGVAPDTVNFLSEKLKTLAR